MNAVTPITPAIDTTFVPVWTQDPRAVAILATFASYPPETKTLLSYERWTREPDIYVGDRVDALHAIYNEYGEPILAHCDAIDDYAAFQAFTQGQPDVQQAVENALRIPALTPIATTIRALDPAIWGSDLDEREGVA